MDAAGFGLKDHADSLSSPARAVLAVPMLQSRCSARLRGIRVPDIPISVHDRSGRLRPLPSHCLPSTGRLRTRQNVREIAVQCAATAEAAADIVDVVMAKSSPRRRRWRAGVICYAKPTGPEASSSEDSLFNELTREDPETPVCESDIAEEDETPTWIYEAEADEEASEEEPCFFIDIEGETFWLDDDDLSCTSSSPRW